MFSFIELKVIDQFNLQPAIDYRNQYNKSNKLPYHNNQHMDFMLQDCIEYYLHELTDRNTFAVGDATFFNYESLFFAAIFHDVNHSGGRLTDDLNIQEALSFWQEYCFSHSEIDAYVASSVEWLIHATQYPYLDLNTRPEAPHHKMYELANALRDADLMSIYHGEAGKKMSGVQLYNEIRCYNTMSYATYIGKQETFLNAIEWRTDWAKRKAVFCHFPSLVKQVLADMRLMDLLDTIEL